MAMSFEQPDLPESTEDGTEPASELSPGTESSQQTKVKHVHKPVVHEVAFVSYPKLLFIWPLILGGFVFYPFGGPHHPISATVAAYEAAQVAESAEVEAAEEGTGDAEAGDAGKVAAAPPPKRVDPFVAGRLEVLGWIYIWIAVLVLLTISVDVGRNQAVFWVVLLLLVWVGGRYLADVQNFTLFGDVYRWFANLHVQYDRSFALALSIIMLVPYVVMLIYARLNDKWRITHNEFEHYSLGKMDDSLGRGAKTIRTAFPDVFELLLGLAGTLIVYNATGTKELRRIPHIMFLPFIRKRLNLILERTAITAAQMEEEEDDDDA